MQTGRRTAIVNRVRAPRYVPDRDLMVESKTIGSDISYKLTTENVSRSGMLLSWQRSVQVPFLVNTIVEMRIDPRGEFLSMPVNCLGKVVRRDDESGVRFGVQIIQIDNDDMVAWENCLAIIEKRSSQLFDDAKRAVGDGTTN